MKDKNVLIMGALDGSVAGQSPRQLGSPRIHVGSRGPPRACGCQPGASLIAARSCPGIVLNIARAGLNLRLGFCSCGTDFLLRVHTGRECIPGCECTACFECAPRVVAARGSPVSRQLGADWLVDWVLGTAGRKCVIRRTETSLTSATPDPLGIFVLSCGTNSGRSVAPAASFLAGISWIATVGASM